jgi:F0F1-type ATP synthase membrane subunit b/b'
MDALGINVINMVINLILFGAFFAIIHKVVGKKLSEVLTERQKIVAQSLDQSNKAKEATEIAKEESAKIIENSQREAERIINSARVLAEKDSKEILEKVELEAADIKKKASTLLTAHQKKLDLEFESKVETTVKSALEKLIRENPEFTK